MRILYSKTARRFLEQQTDEARHDIRGIVVLLSTDPAVDGATKVLMPYLPVFLPCFKGSRWWIAYQVDGTGDNEALLVLAIAPAGKRPSL